MIRRLLYLNGLAALMVPIHHAAAYGFSAMFLWTDRYRPVTVPNYDQLGSLSYYVLLVLRQMTTTAIPAFLIVSGFFIAFANKTDRTQRNWTFGLVRIKKLIAPFIIWTVIVFILIRRLRPSFNEILNMYYYVPLISQYYLLSPLFVILLKSRWKWLLIVTAIVQLGLQSLRYFSIFNWGFPGLDEMISFTPKWFFLGKMFYFAVGLVIGFHTEVLREWLSRSRWKLLMMSILLAVISIGEYELISRFSGKRWVVSDISTFSTALLAVTVALCVLAFENKSFQFSELLSDLGSQSLGIYFVNTPIIFIVGAFMYRVTTKVLGFQLIYQTVLIVFGVSVPLILMSIIKRSPARKIYNFLFG